MAERLICDPAICVYLIQATEIGLPICKGEVLKGEDCPYNSLDGNYTVRKFKSGYRIPPEKDILNQIASVRLTIFSRKK